jgi:thiamine-monophosphate kinase
MRAPRGEFELIDAFVSVFDPSKDEGVILGIGDDAAVLRLRGLTALTTDSVMEGVHFTPAFSPEDVGHKALAVNLSDLAAMGAQPVAFLCALAVPPPWVSRVVRVGRGMAALASKHRCALVGGNVTRARQLSITITALGRVAHPLTRAGARPGDVLLVSGSLGGAAAGLARRPRPTAAQLRRQRRPTPRVELGLAAVGRAHAAIDVSDGFVQDLRHLLEASGVGADVDSTAVPRVAGASLEQALSGGEDYELILAAPRSRVPELLRAARSLHVSLTAVGRCTREPGLRMPGSGPLPGGFDHLR